MLKVLDAGAWRREWRDPVDAEVLSGARAIVESVRTGGESALRTHGERFGEVLPGAPLLLQREALARAFDGLSPADQALLERVAARIRRFAEAQRASLRDLDLAIPGGRAGHRVVPVAAAGCYAPGGRFPLPSTVLMGVVTARAAGVPRVIVASPRPTAMTLGAAHVAGADALVPLGGAHAIAAMALGTGAIPRVDTIVGPGNKWVTAAKHVVSAYCGIDMLAGPSELLVLADDTGNPATIAADLLAQAEHDPDALPMLVTTSRSLAEASNDELARQLPSLPTRENAEASLRNGFAIVVEGLEEAITIAGELAPEHLQVHARDAAGVAARVSNFGAAFIGAGTAEVLGDYGAGPNHSLPTGGRARYTAGLSVFNFLRARTFLELDAPDGEMVRDAIALARHEGLEAHARAAERRL